MRAQLDRPGRAEKTAFFGGTAGSFFIGGVTGFLLLYLTDELKISAGAVGTMLLVARLVDGAVDPLLGYAVDHLPVTRWGRFRPYALIGTALSAVGLATLFTVPGLVAHPLAASWVIYLLWGLFFGVMSIPLVALIPAVTDDPRSRAHLAGIVGFTGLLASAAVSALTLPLVDAFGGGPSGWSRYATVVAAVSLGLVTVMVFRVRERVVPLSPERYRLADVRRVFFSDRAVPTLLVCKVTVASASGALTAALPFFFLYYMGDKNLLSAAAVVMAIPMGVGAVTIPSLARRTGIKPYYLLSLGFSIVGLGSLYLLPAQVGVVLVCFAVTGLGFGGVAALNLLLLAELTDYIEWRQGFRAEATLAAMVSFATKAGSGVGAGLVAYVLAFSDFEGGAKTQTAEAVRGVLMGQSLIPAALGVVGALMFLAYPINRAVSLAAAAALTESRAEALEPA